MTAAESHSRKTPLWFRLLKEGERINVETDQALFAIVGWKPVSFATISGWSRNGGRWSAVEYIPVATPEILSAEETGVLPMNPG